MAKKILPSGAEFVFNERKIKLCLMMFRYFELFIYFK